MICAFWSCRLHCYIVQCSQSNVDVISLTDDSTIDISRLILHYCWLCAVRLCRRYVVRLHVVTYLPSCALSFMITLYIICICTLELHSQSMQKLHCVRKKRGQPYILYIHNFERFTRRRIASSRAKILKKIINTTNICMQFIQQLDLISVATTLRTLQNDVGLLANRSILVTWPTAQHRYGPQAHENLWKMVRLILKSVAERIIKAQSCACKSL